MALGSDKAKDTFRAIGKLAKAAAPFTVRLKPEMRARLERAAADQGRSASELARQFIAEGLARLE